MHGSLAGSNPYSMCTTPPTGTPLLIREVAQGGCACVLPARVWAGGPASPPAASPAATVLSAQDPRMRHACCSLRSLAWPVCRRQRSSLRKGGVSVLSDASATVARGHRSQTRHCQALPGTCSRKAPFAAACSPAPANNHRDTTETHACAYLSVAAASLTPHLTHRHVSCTRPHLPPAGCAQSRAVGHLHLPHYCIWDPTQSRRRTHVARSLLAGRPRPGRTRRAALRC